MAKHPWHNENSKLRGETKPKISFKVRCRLSRFPTLKEAIAKVRKAYDERVENAGYNPRYFKGFLRGIGLSKDKNYLIVRYEGFENRGREVQP